TFLASLLLAEVKGQMGNVKADAQVAEALDKVVAKIAKHQQKDGAWANAGWAPVLAQSIAAKGLNRAAQNGVKVEDRVLALAEKNARDNFQPTAPASAAGGGLAGASLGAAGLAGDGRARGIGGPGGIAGGTAGGFRMDGAASVPLYAAAANSAAGQD